MIDTLFILIKIAMISVLLVGIMFGLGVYRIEYLAQQI